jgi:hypothetical protein
MEAYVNHFSDVKLAVLRIPYEIRIIPKYKNYIWKREIRENWNDMNRRYFNETDPEMLKIFKELEDESNISR